MASSGSVNTSAYSNRHLTFSWTEKSQSIENNKTVISWTLKGGGSASGYYKTRNIKLTLNGTTVYSFAGNSGSYVSLYNGTEVASGEFTIVHDVEGKGSLDVYVEAGIYVWEANCSGSGSFALDTIPRASTLTASNGTLGVEQSLTIERASSGFKHRLTYRCGDTEEYIAGSADSYTTETSIAWTPLIGLAAENTTGTSVSITLTLYTYASDGTHIGTTTKAITCAIPTSVKPSVSLSWEDTTGVADIYGNPVQGLSKLKISVLAKTSYGAKIIRYTVTANGFEYAFSNGSSVTTEALKASGSQKINATVKDQRGRTGSNSETLDVLAYSPPSVFNLSVHRCDAGGTENSQGDHVRVTFSADVANLHAMNPITYKLRYKNSTASDYTEVDLTGLDGVTKVRDYAYIFAADGNSSYDVEVVVFDGHNTATRATSASTAFTMINWHPNGTGISFGKVSEREHAAEFALDIYDKFDTPIGNGLARYTGSGDYAIDANTTTDHLILTNRNTPDGKWFYVKTEFYYDKTVTSNRAQLAIPYNSAAGAPAYRHYIGSWTEWKRLVTMDEVYPVGSIVHRYDHTDPATLFGGTWTRISSYILRGATASGTIGTTGTLADGSGQSYINVSIWRRTA